MYKFPTNFDLNSLLEKEKLDDGVLMAGLRRYCISNPESSFLEARTKALLTKAKFGYVYVLVGTHKGNMKFKIGKANNLKDRVKTFNVKIPFDIDVYSAFYIREPLKFEHELHALYGHKRIAGEWFDLSVDDLSAIVKRGFQRELDDTLVIMDKDFHDWAKEYMLSDAEYIDYLESMLVMHGVKFHKRIEWNGAQIFVDGRSVD